MNSAKNQYLAAILCSLGPLCFGLLIGWIPPILPLLLSENTPLEAPLTLEESSWVVSVEYIGKLAGTFSFGYLVDIIGRKTTACISIIPILMSTLLVVFARTATHINLSRLFMGFGGGGCYASVSIYVAEISEIKIRGKLGAIYMVNMNLGITTGIVLGSLLTYYTLAYILVAATSVAFILTLFLPESPVYLLQKGKKEEAAKNLRWFRGKPCEEDQNVLQTLTDSFQPTIVPKQTALQKYKQLLTKVTLKGLLIGIMIFVFQQGSGYFPVVYYSSVIFAESSSFLSPNLSLIIVEVWKNIALIAANFLIEKTGRRLLLLISSAGVVVSLFFIGFYLYLKFIHVDLSSYGWIPLVIICIYTFLYSIGLGIIPYVIVTEIFSAEIKATAVCICVMFYGIMSFIVSKIFSPLVLAFGWHGCFWFFGVFSIIGTLFLWIFVPETKQRTTDAILKDILGKKQDTICT